MSVETISQTVRSYQETRSEKDFDTIYKYCLPIFRNWYRHVQRYTNLDRSTLLSEFQYIVMRAARGFDSSSPVPDGFIRYFRSAAKKHSLTLRREAMSDIDVYPLRHDWDVVDPKSLAAWEEMEVLDIINTCFMGDERALVMLKLMGEQSNEVQAKLKLTDFQFRSLVRNVKSNRALQRTLSRDV